MKRLPVIVENGEAKVCQKCLVKWARRRSFSMLLCNKCYAKESAE